MGQQRSRHVSANWLVLGWVRLPLRKLSRDQIDEVDILISHSYFGRFLIRIRFHVLSLTDLLTIRKLYLLTNRLETIVELNTNYLQLKIV